ncbi:hypothetical protein LMG28614_01363 [Paraburkholderia ultramafica]|uniref:Uncharacterized protein n=1 Tax=Paraburkholderia ultramafica TaxID=1544867 RepID=A0A6S7AZI7_9BURK|nr:hypothetical protein [Paraburkholderia ultramafica]CAB3782079.1 hypothetical protein LMG28614_01363 [Paraburkholderia ultramafica]
MSGTELKTDAWHRYVMYRSDDSSLMPFASREEKQQAGEAGRKFTASAYPEVWAQDAALVARVRQFLGANFHWHGRLTKNGTAQEVVQTLHDMVRGGSVIVVPEKALGGGSVGSGTSAASAPAYAALDPEDAEQMRAFARSILYPPGEPVLSGDYSPDREASGQLAAAKAAMSGDDGSLTTPLGDAQPFEYSEDVSSGDVQDLAARGLSEEEEAECGALYDRDMEECNFARAIYQDPRTYAVCTQRAFSNYQSCRGY